VVAAFHTHPNPPIDEAGQEWEQYPSTADRRWHQRHRLGGFVVSAALIYQIDAHGNVQIVGERDKVLSS
jgi:hypothetical protein